MPTHSNGNGWLTRALFGAALTVLIALAAGTSAKAFANSERIGRCEENGKHVEKTLERIESKLDALLGVKGRNP